MRVVVLGAGIAGLAAGHVLATRGVEVTIVEQEPFFFGHSSGRNAAIYRPLELSPGVVPLARRSLELLDTLLGERRQWLDQKGLWLVAPTVQALSKLLATARESDLSTSLASRAELEEHLGVLRGGRAGAGLFVPDGGVLDPHAIGSALASGFRRAGGQLLLQQRVERIAAGSRGPSGVLLHNGDILPADRVVIAAGAWAQTLGATLDLALPLTPIRRHLALLSPSVPLAANTPAVWDVELEAYFRPEPGGILASPCDERAWTPELPAVDHAALELLAERLPLLAPGLADAAVARSWACLRTFAPDRGPVIGADPRCPALYWVAGLGGFGMTCGTAAGELCALDLLGENHDQPLAALLSPRRLL